MIGWSCRGSIIVKHIDHLTQSMKRGAPHSSALHISLVYRPFRFKFIHNFYRRQDRPRSLLQVLQTNSGATPPVNRSHKSRRTRQWHQQPVFQIMSQAWRQTRMSLCLEEWEMRRRRMENRFTTIWLLVRRLFSFNCYGLNRWLPHEDHHQQQGLERNFSRTVGTLAVEGPILTIKSRGLPSKASIALLHSHDLLQFTLIEARTKHLQNVEQEQSRQANIYRHRRARSSWSLGSSCSSMECSLLQ